MKYFCFIVFFISCCYQGKAQQKPVEKIQFGLELDALPYVTGGYFAAAWAGKQQWRARVLTASVNKPDWTTTNGFLNHHIYAYALVADHFFKPGWKGWWVSGGLVFWKSSIQTDSRFQTSNFQNFLLNGSLGYNISFFRNFYLSPWAGLSIRTAGDRNVPVDNKQFTLPLFNPEASIKLGYSF